MTFFQSLGQDITTLIESISQYFNHSYFVSIYPNDIQAVLVTVMIVLLIVAIKRAVIS